MGNVQALQHRIAELEERNRRLEVLYETARDLGSSLKLDELLQRILNRTLEVLRSEIGSVLIFDPDEEVLWLRASRGLDVGDGEATGLSLGEGISGWVARERKPLLVQDIEEDPRFGRRNLERYNTCSLVSAPLLTQDRLLGVMNVNNKIGGEIYTSEDLDLLVTVASQAAVAIENANLFEETLTFTYIDPLTHLYNHPSFQNMLEREFDRAQRYRRPLSLVLIDIDNFKPYNDRHGHNAGDKALTSIAGLISAKSRSSDVLSRFGADEFAVLLPEAESKSARRFAERVRQSVEANSFLAATGDLSEQLTVSAGVATYPEDALTRTVLLDVAEGALFQSKFTGKNKVSGPEDI